jgi:hypothetical protein
VATEGRRGSVGRPSTMPLRVAHLSSSATNTTPHHFYKKGNSDRDRLNDTTKHQIHGHPFFSAENLIGLQIP